VCCVQQTTRMSSQATRQRKGGMPPKSGEHLPMTGMISETTTTTTTTSATTTTTKTNNPNPTTLKPALMNTVKFATVKRNKYGTGPFDENWLNLDCCGLFCAIITYLLHVYGVYAVCLILIPPWMSTVDENGVRTISPMGHFHRIAFTLTAVLAVYAHFKAMTTNPGAVPPDAIPLEEMKDLNNNNDNPNEENNGEQTSSLMVEEPPKPPPPRKGRRVCRRCNSFKPKRAHHCSICKRCIIKMDHHCPWVNNCVGIGNHKYFLLFIFYTCLSCMYSLTLLTVRFFDCLGHHGHVRTHHLTCLDRPTQLLSVLGLFVEAILFGLFTLCMMFDQSGVVMTKITSIDRLKGGSTGGDGNKSSAKVALAGVIEVFGLSPKKEMDLGGRFRADWLSPFHRICFPTTVRDEVMGFCKPCTTRMSSGSSDHSGETEMSPMMRNVANIV